MRTVRTPSFARHYFSDAELTGWALEGIAYCPLSPPPSSPSKRPRRKTGPRRRKLRVKPTNSTTKKGN